MSRPITHIIVTGGTGYIGARLAEMAASLGKTAVTLGRQNASKNTIKWVLGDALPQCDVPWMTTAIIHLAHDWNDRDETGRNYLGTKILLESSRAKGAARFIFVSSQSARPDSVNAYGRIKYNIEQFITGADAASIRVGLVYGGSAKGLYGLILKLISKLPILPMIEAKRAVQPIHIDDVCRGLLLYAESDVTGWHGLASPQPITFENFLKKLAREIYHRRLIVFPVPLALALLGCKIIEKIPFLPHVDRERILGLAGVQLLECADDMQALGINVKSTEIAPKPLAIKRRDLILEGKILCAYLLGQKPGFSIIKRYVRSVANLEDAGIQVKLPHIVTFWPWLLNVIEPFNAETRLGLRLRIAATLVENTSQGARIFHSENKILGWLKLFLSLCGNTILFPCRFVFAKKI